MRIIITHQETQTTRRGQKDSLVTLSGQSPHLMYISDELREAGSTHSCMSNFPKQVIYRLVLFRCLTWLQCPLPILADFLCSKRIQKHRTQPYQISTSDKDPLQPSANKVTLALSSMPLWKVSFLTPDLATPMSLVATPATPPFL